MSSTDDQFPDRNLDVLRSRVASGMPQRPSTVDEAVVAELEDLREAASAVRLEGSSASWLTDELDRRVAKRRRPHVAAQEDDGDQD